MRMLQLRLTQPRRSIREALEGRVQAPHLRNSTSWFKRRERQKRKPGESRYVYAKCAWSTNLVPVDGPAPTLLASNNNLTWIQLEGGQVHRSVITAEEAKRLQTFPASFILPDNRALAQRRFAKRLSLISLINLLKETETGLAYSTGPDSERPLFQPNASKMPSAAALQLIF